MMVWLLLLMCGSSVLAQYQSCERGRQCDLRCPQGSIISGHCCPPPYYGEPLRSCQRPQFRSRDDCICLSYRYSGRRSKLLESRNEIPPARQSLFFDNIMDTFVQGTRRLERAMEMLHEQMENIDVRLKWLEGGRSDTTQPPSTGDSRNEPDEDFNGSSRDLQCPVGFVSIDGSCWYFSKNSVTWIGAREECKRRHRDAVLADFGPKKEYEQLLNYMKNPKEGDDDALSLSSSYWINSRRGDNGWVWRFPDKEEGIFWKWTPYERIGESFQSLRNELRNPNEECLTMRAELLALMPADCNMRKTYMCRISRTSNNVI